MRRVRDCVAAVGLPERHSAPRCPAGDGSCRRCSAGADQRGAHDVVIARASAWCSTAARRRQASLWPETRDGPPQNCMQTGRPVQASRPGDLRTRPRRSVVVTLAVLISLSWITSICGQENASTTTSSSSAFTSTTVADSTATPITTTSTPTTDPISSTPTPTIAPAWPIPFPCEDGQYRVNHSKLSNLTSKYTFTRSSNFDPDDVAYLRLLAPGGEQHPALGSLPVMLVSPPTCRPCLCGLDACQHLLQKADLVSFL
jgi:hypothetical protein